MSGLGAAALLARLAWIRILRGRALWMTITLLVMPTILAMMGPSEPEHWRVPIEVINALLIVLPAMHLATVVSDEVDDHTFTYLWSRPIPRWSLLVGKLLAVWPPLIAMFAVSIAAAFWALHGETAAVHINLLGRAVAAVCVGVVAVGAVATGLGTLVTRYPLASTIAYMLMVDVPIGQVPLAINQLSITHHVRVIAGVPDTFERYATAMGIYDASSMLVAAAWATGIGAMWLGMALWRVSVAEYANK